MLGMRSEDKAKTVGQYIFLTSLGLVFFGIVSIMMNVIFMFRLDYSLGELTPRFMVSGLILLVGATLMVFAGHLNGNGKEQTALADLIKKFFLS